MIPAICVEAWIYWTLQRWSGYSCKALHN